MTSIEHTFDRRHKFLEQLINDKVSSRTGHLATVLNTPGSEKESNVDIKISADVKYRDRKQ